MFASLARLATRHPWWVVGGWVLVAIVVIAVSPTIASVTNADQASFLPSQDQSVRAQAALTQAFPEQAGDTELAVVRRADGGTLTSADEQRVSALAADLGRGAVPGVSGAVTSPLLRSPDGHVQLVDVFLHGAPGTAAVNHTITALRATLPHELAGTGLTAGVTGAGSVALDTSDAFAKAETVIAIATIALIVILLGLIFRSAVVAVLPVVVIGLVHQLVGSVVADLARAFDFDVGTLLAPLLIVVLFGIGTDYFVFLMFRYRERLRAGEAPRDALCDAATTVGEVVSSSALTVMAAFAALLLSSLGLLRTLAPGLIVAVALMLLATLTLVPAVLALLGPKAFWPSRATAPEAPRTNTYESRIGRYVGRHPGRIVAAYGGVLVVIALAAFGYRANYDAIAELPDTSPSVVAYHEMQQAFPPGAVGPTQVVATSDGGGPLPTPAVSELEARLSHTPGVAAVLPTQFNADHSAALLTVTLDTNPYSGQALATVQGPVRTAADGSVPGATVLVGGPTSQSVDIRDAINHDLAIIFPVAALIIAVILGLLLRAVVGPLYLLVGVGLGFLATLGILVLIFQHGIGLGGLDFSIPIVLYLFVVAIGTDYNILMTARLREELRSGKRPADAVGLAITHGAPAVAAAGVILAGTFASLLLTTITTLAQLGAGVSIGIVVSAFVMAPRLIPAVAGMRRWHFWWPGSIDRRTAAHTSHLGLHDRRHHRAGPFPARSGPIGPDLDTTVHGEPGSREGADHGPAAHEAADPDPAPGD